MLDQLVALLATFATAENDLPTEEDGIRSYLEEEAPELYSQMTEESGDDAEEEIAQLHEHNETLQDEVDRLEAQLEETNDELEEMEQALEEDDSESAQTVRNLRAENEQLEEALQDEREERRQERAQRHEDQALDSLRNMLSDRITNDRVVEAAILTNRDRIEAGPDGIEQVLQENREDPIVSTNGQTELEILGEEILSDVADENPELVRSESDTGGGANGDGGATPPAGDDAVSEAIEEGRQQGQETTTAEQRRNTVLG